MWHLHDIELNNAVSFALSMNMIYRMQNIYNPPIPNDYIYIHNKLDTSDPFKNC